MGTIQIDGSTPKITVGNATAEDATILFDGNAQDFYIALDDSADDLLIGLGSTVGTTPAIAIDENLKVNIPVTTASTSASTGSLTTGGGAGIGADLYVGDDVYLITDSAVLGFGADKDTTLTHTDGTGLTLNSTNKLCFNDASQYIQGASNAILDIAATDEIELTATLVDVNANLDVSGTYTGAGLMTTGGNIVIPNAGNIGSASDTDAIAIASNGVTTFSQAPVFPDGSIAVADIDIDGATDIGADIVDADLFIIDDGAGGTNRKTVASRLKTYIGGGITMADSWRMTNNQTVSTGNEDLSDDGGAAWARVNSDGYGVLGSALTEDGTAGVFSFPATGMYYITASAIMQKNGSSRYNDLNIMTTGDNSTYGIASTGRGFVIQTDSDTTISELFTDFILDVSNTTNVKFKLNVLVASGDIAIIGDSATIFSGFTVIRLGDT